MKIFQILFFILVFVSISNAQEFVTKLKGIVYNQEKKVVPSTAITITGIENFVVKAISDENGFYQVWLPVGKYEILFSKHGYKKLVVKNYEDTERLGKTLNVNLEIGFCNDCNGTPYSDEPENIRKPNEVDFLKPKEKTGILRGLAVDQYGAVLSDLVVKFKNKRNEEFQALTNKQGIYAVRLPFGKYKVEAQHFDKLKSKVLKIKINKAELSAPNLVLNWFN